MPSSRTQMRQHLALEAPEGNPGGTTWRLGRGQDGEARPEMGISVTCDKLARRRSQAASAPPARHGSRPAHTKRSSAGSPCRRMT